MVAIRGTMSMADVVTDAVVHPEGIDDWLPPAFSEVLPVVARSRCADCKAPNGTLKTFLWNLSHARKASMFSSVSPAA